MNQRLWNVFFFDRFHLSLSSPGIVLHEQEGKEDSKEPAGMLACCTHGC
jgi:hypothetical protein